MRRFLVLVVLAILVAVGLNGVGAEREGAVFATNAPTATSSFGTAVATPTPAFGTAVP